MTLEEFAIHCPSEAEEIARLFKGGTKDFAAELIGIVSGLRIYWPLTVRQVYYQAVAKLIVPNCLNSYQRTSRVLTKLRRNHLLGWGAIEDRTRRTTDKRGVEGLDVFIKNQTESFLDWRYYHRCRVQDQDQYLEVAIEKDALSSIVEDVAWPYCCRLNVVRGQVSATMVKDMAARFSRARKNGQHPVLLYFGDLDPSGVRIPKSLIEKMWEFHYCDVELDRRALNPEQVEEYGLPEDFDAAKPSDPNYDYWLDHYGDCAPTELDALHPGDLKDLVTEAIEDHLDMDAYQDQMDIEDEEREELKEMRRNIMTYARDQYPGYFGEVA